ncbi:MAG: hypothetical protein DMF51_01560 [Acidobacteria bacterium]|nr:MAG: hypothetical protein DMF51_01560 [Acidobacteriota bacterium]
MRRLAVVLVMAAAFSSLVIQLQCASRRIAGVTAGTPAPSPTPVATRPSPAGSQASTSPAASPSPSEATIDFATRILPLLQERCSPCHFPGGRMYDRLPFDKEMTIRLLGTRLFTRLRDPEDQEIVGAFLEQSPQPAR